MRRAYGMQFTRGAGIVPVDPAFNIDRGTTGFDIGELDLQGILRKIGIGPGDGQISGPVVEAPPPAMPEITPDGFELSEEDLEATFDLLSGKTLFTTAAVGIGGALVGGLIGYALGRRRRK